MRQARAFAALVAPWLAQPGDIAMRPIVVAIVLLLLVLGALTVGYGGLVVVRELLPGQQREDAQ